MSTQREMIASLDALAKQPEGCFDLVHNERQLGLSVRRANTLVRRLKGLIGQPSLGVNQVLLIFPCNSVHTLAMKFAIDVVFLSRCGRVLDVRCGLAPMRAAMRLNAFAALELSAGSAQRLGLLPGERVSWCALFKDS